MVLITVIVTIPMLQSSGDSGANVKRLEKEYDSKIEQLKAQSSNISHEVVQMLLKFVTTVKSSNF